MLLTHSQTEEQGAQGDAKEIGNHIVDVEAPIGEQVLDRLGEERQEERGEPGRQQATAEEREIEEIEHARDIDGRVEEMVEADAEDEIVERDAQPAHGSPHEEQQQGEIAPTLTKAATRSEEAMRQVAQGAASRDPTRAAAPGRRLAMVDSAVGMVDSDQTGPDGGARDRLGETAIVAPEEQHAPALSQQAMDDAAPLVEKEIDIARAERFVGSHGAEGDLVGFGIDERQHAVTAKGDTHREALQETVVELLDDEAVLVVGEGDCFQNGVRGKSVEIAQECGEDSLEGQGREGSEKRLGAEQRRVGIGQALEVVDRRLGERLGDEVDQDVGEGREGRPGRVRREGEGAVVLHQGRRERRLEGSEGAEEREPRDGIARRLGKADDGLEREMARVEDRRLAAPRTAEDDGSARREGEEGAVVVEDMATRNRLEPKAGVGALAGARFAEEKDRLAAEDDDGAVDERDARIGAQEGEREPKSETPGSDIGARRGEDGARAPTVGEASERRFGLGAAHEELVVIALAEEKALAAILGEVEGREQDAVGPRALRMVERDLPKRLEARLEEMGEAAGAVEETGETRRRDRHGEARQGQGETVHHSRILDWRSWSIHC